MAAAGVDLLRLAEDGLAEFVRHTARHGRNAVIEERDGLLLVAGSHSAPGPYRNMAMRERPGLDANEVFARADAFFTTRRRSYVLWVMMHADEDLEAEAQARGLDPLESSGLAELYMTEPPPLVEPPSGVTVLPALGHIERRDFLRVNAAAWGMEGVDDETAADMFFEPSSLDAPNVAPIIAYQGGRPVSTAMAIVHQQAVGGYWGATIPDARKQGLGDVVVRRMFNAGFELGGEVAVFQASGMGEQIWRRMGAEELTRFRRYLVTTTSILIASAWILVVIATMLLWLIDD